MKITIESIPAGNEPEIIIRCSEMDESLMQLVYNLKTSARKLIGMYETKMHLIDPKDVFYFESVDNRVFIYCRDKVYESRLKLYEIEEEYENTDFFRASKSTVLNLSKIESLRLDLSGRYEALLQNGEKAVISRQYVPVLKTKLGI